MRSEAALLIRSAVTWSIPRGQIALRPPAGPLLAPIRPVSTSPSLLKKSKAASTKQSHQQSKEDHPEAESSRYENAPEGELDKVLERTKGKMSKSVDWARGIAYESVERGRGRISPALLDSVKVMVPEVPGSRSLNSVASVTVKGNALYVDVWEDDVIKHVESAIHQANLPGMSPQKVDNSTLRIPISPPTHDQRIAILKQLGAAIENAKNQVRVARQEGMSALGGRGSEGTEEVQKLANDFGAELDEVLVQAKREFDK